MKTHHEIYLNKEEAMKLCYWLQGKGFSFDWNIQSHVEHLREGELLLSYSGINFLIEK